MKNLRKTALLSVVVLLVGALGSSIAEARPAGGHSGAHGGSRGGHYYHGGGRGYYYAAPIFVGAYFASRYYYPPAYYYPPVYYPPAAPTYIEQPVPYTVPPQSQYQEQYQQPQMPQQGQAQPDSQAYWYYCQASRGYYPHVQSCPGGWQRVTPQAPPR